MTFAELLRDRSRLFWILNTSGWAGYALAAWLGALAHEKPEAYFAVIVASAVSGFAATSMLRLLYRKLWTKSVTVLGIATLVTCYVVAFFWQWMRNVLYYDWVKNDWQPEHLMDYVGGVMGSFYIMLCWSGLYFGIKYYQQLQEQTEQTLKAVAAAHQAQLKMLRYQLNPHFLFNTLNAISTLILDGANKTANQAVSRLSDFLRYTLDNDPMSRVTLGSELDALDLYLEIEKVRFGDRLIIEKDIDDHAAKAVATNIFGVIGREEPNAGRAVRAVKLGAGRSPTDEPYKAAGDIAQGFFAALGDVVSRRDPAVIAGS